MGAREIADGLKKARFRTFSEANEALAPLRDHAKRLYAAGGPTMIAALAKKGIQPDAS